MTRNKTTKSYSGRGVFRRLLGFLSPYGWFIAGMMLFALGQAGLALYIPIIIGNAVDMALGAGMVDFAGILPLLVRIAAATVISAKRYPTRSSRALPASSPALSPSSAPSR